MTLVQPGAGRMSEYVFGYGSLVAGHPDGHVTELRGHRRCWGVAMDNCRDLPGYKWYRLRASGERPAVFVAFLDIVAAGDAAPPVNGVCHPVGAAELAALDARERNYERVDVTAAVALARGRVWAYAGSAAGRARLAAARRAGTAIVSRDYLATVEAAFTRLGPAALSAFHASTAPPEGLPVLDLERVELAG
jgi:Gamma-glutamyl cyclotransferase, AIG2-like